MSGMDDRARQFKTAAESQATGPALKKEIGTLRRFLFRNQEYRFTKAAQQALYMAVLAHYGNPAAHHASGYAPSATIAEGTATASSSSSAAPVVVVASTAAASRGAKQQSDDDGDDAAVDDRAAEAPVLRLLDDALKMPFTVFTSAQKDKLLGLYWSVLGTEGPSGGGRANPSAAEKVNTLTLSLMDIVDTGKNAAHLSLLTSEGEEYVQEVLVDDVATLKQLRGAFDAGSAVSVVVEENDSGARFVSFTIEDE